MVNPATTADAPVHARATVRPDKAETVAEMAEAFRTSAATLLTDYRGLTVKQITDLRTALGTDTTYSVVKNTLTRRAAEDAGMPGLTELLVGPTAVAFVSGDPVEAAKGLRDFAKANPALVVKGGVLDGKSLSPAEISKLADLESREVLLGKLAGAMLGTLSKAVYLFNAPLAQVARLAGALEAKAQEDPSIIAGAGEAPASTEPVATEPAATEPVAPEATASEDAASEASAADATASEDAATEPEATEPEATEPEATEPEATELAEDASA